MVTLGDWITPGARADFYRGGAAPDAGSTAEILGARIMPGESINPGAEDTARKCRRRADWGGSALSAFRPHDGEARGQPDKSAVFLQKRQALVGTADKTKKAGIAACFCRADL